MKWAEKAVNKAAPNCRKKPEKHRSDPQLTEGNKYGKPYSTGELEASIVATNARDNSLGVFAVVKPNGTDKNGLRNAEKMGYLEYGVRSHGQEPRPVRAAAVAQSENAVMQVMEEVIGAEDGQAVTINQKIIKALKPLGHSGDIQIF